MRGWCVLLTRMGRAPTHSHPSADPFPHPPRAPEHTFTPRIDNPLPFPKARYSPERDALPHQILGEIRGEHERVQRAAHAFWVGEEGGEHAGADLERCLNSVQAVEEGVLVLLREKWVVVVVVVSLRQRGCTCLRGGGPRWGGGGVLAALLCASGPHHTTCRSLL